MNDRLTTRRRFIRDSIGSLAGASLLGSGAWAEIARSAREKGMNVLFIMSDQHNARAMGCAGNKEIQTPNLDRLAKEGIYFPNAFCQTGQCCPSRYTIWTGRYAHSHGCRWNGVVEPLSEITVGEIFKEAGYATGTIGKHHMKNHPRDHGFDTVIDNPEYNQFAKETGAPNWNQEGEWMERKLQGPVGASAATNDEHPTGFWTAKAIEFMEDHKDDPFCLWLSYYGPHTPICPSKPWADMYDPANLTLPPSNRPQATSMPRQLAEAQKKHGPMTEDEHRRVLAYYYGYVSQIDFNIGRALDSLEDLGLSDKTMVVYTADHGEMMSEHGVWTKFTLCCDSTVHVPYIVRMPGGKNGGKVVDELVGSVDLMPTICSAAGLEVPAAVQGRSLLPLIEVKETIWRDVIFSEIGYPGRAAGRSAMARSKTHKYIHNENFRNPCEELYDLIKDPWETKNEIENPQYADLAKRLRKALADWDASTDHAPMYPIGPEDAPPKPAGADRTTTRTASRPPRQEAGRR